MIDTPFQIKHCGGSDIGLVRNHNEDIWQAFPEKGLFILADGMGGHAAGEIAAKEAVQYLADLVKEWNPTKQTNEQQAIAFFREAMDKVNALIYQHGQSDPSLTGMGTTICVLFILQSHAILVHVGDSRIYRLRNKKLEQLTEDHSLVSELISLGAMKPDESALFPYKHILTRAIGTQPKIEATANFSMIEKEDLFLLCSDGLTNYVTDQEILQILLERMSLQEKVNKLIERANLNGGGDNITLILVLFNDLSR